MSTQVLDGKTDRKTEVIRVDPLRIRIATVRDMDEIMALALMACGENEFLRHDPEKLATAIWPLLANDHGFCPVIGREGGAIEGFALLSIGEMWYARGRVVEEKAIFIHPEYRSAKGGRARQLCQFSKRVADDLGIPLIIGVLSNHRTAAKMRMYQREFGEPSGAFFLYGAQTGTT